VSGATPFAAGCEGAGAQRGTLHANAEVEPFLAVNPLDPANWIGVWQQDRWANGGARGLLTAVTFDGGTTWTRVAVPFSRCAGGGPGNGGDYERSSDPWVTFGPDGTAHQISLSFSGGALRPGSSSAVLASRSSDGGRTWTEPVALIRDGDQYFDDKESITADPTDPRFVYAAWDRLALAGGGPSYFARSADGGRSWEAARPIHDPGPGSQTINNQVVVLPDGTLVTFFTQLDAAAGGEISAHLAVVRSTDNGDTWSPPIRISDLLVRGARDPERGTPIRDGAGLGSIAVGSGGELVAAWQDSRFSGGQRDAIALARSADGGLTWSAPVPVNGDMGVQAFTPAVHVRADGAIGVTYYDLRSNTPDPDTLPTDFWLAASGDGTSWVESRVQGPFDLSTAPDAGGLFLGDYQGLASVGVLFVPLYTRTTGDPANPTDVFAVPLAPGGTGAAGRAALGERMATDGGESPERRAPAAGPVRVTPAMRQRAQESILRTMEARIPGWGEVVSRWPRRAD
jgi:hypothetical protein